MTYKKHVTVRDMLRALITVPHETIIEIACDPEMNAAGPIAMTENGELCVLDAQFREDGQPVMVMWPLKTEPLEERYADFQDVS
jgi:hypothetical protein